jgi:hypothetical protein
MAPRQNNLLVRLRKWAHRQDENFQTEAFAHLLDYLLDCEPAAAVRLLREVTAGILDLRPEDAGLVSVTTQVTTEESRRPDIEVRAPNGLVYIEAKVESGLGPGQLNDYREELNRSGVEKTGLILLTRYLVTLGDEAEPPNAYVRWFQVADWLLEVPLARQVSGYLAEQFVGFLRARGMTMEKVTWELTNGGRALHSLLAILNEVLTRLGLRPSPNFQFSGPDIGFFADGSQYWVGITLTEPNLLLARTWKFKVDKDKAERLGVASGLFKSNWPKETRGPHRWSRSVDLESEEAHFFSRTKANQLQFVEEFLKGFVETVKKVEAGE